MYRTGSFAGLAKAPEFRENTDLASRISADFACTLPTIARTIREGETIKFTLSLADGSEIEAVIIPMASHRTLCVSTQAGCVRGCAFCRTAGMGLERNLSAGEIVAQYMTARFSFGADITNVVFMGMGEPFDNFEPVCAAVDIFTSPRGPDLLPGNISLSTCGHVPGLKKLAEFARRETGSKRARPVAARESGFPETDPQITGKAPLFSLVTIAISLHSAIDSVRSSLMPVNRLWPLAELKEALLALPHSRIKDRLYFEYLVIPGVNDSSEAADALRAFLQGLTAKVNLIAFVAPEKSTLPPASPEDVERFWQLLRERGIPCFTRKGKGERIRASCGQLAGRSAPESVPPSGRPGGKDRG